MAGPPTDIEASELWLRLTQRPRPSEVVDFPARDQSGQSVGKVRIRVLTMEEQDRARIAADKYVREKLRATGEALSGEVLREVIGDAVAKEVLAVACVGSKSISGDENKPVYPRMFQDGASLGTAITGDELTVLFGQYALVQRRFGPYEKTIDSKQELDAWIRRLVEGGSAYPLAARTLPQLVELTMLLAQRAYSLSAVLERLSSSSAESLESIRPSLDTGTSWSGELPDWLTEIASKPLSEPEPDTFVAHADPITFEQAIEAAKALRDRGPIPQ